MKKKVFSCVMSATMVASSVAALTPVQQVQAKAKTVEVTMFNADGNSDTMSNWNDPISRAITKKTAVKLKQSFPVGDVSQKLAVMLASGKLPDMIYAKGDQTKFITAKKFIDLKPLIEKYGPNIKKLYGKYYKRLTINDPKNKAIYVLPSYGVGGKNLTDPGYFQVQAAVLKEANYPVIRTLSQLESILKAYAKKHPKINGQKTIPISLCADDWYVWISLCNPATFSAGYPDDGNWIINTKTGAAKVTYTSQAHHDFYKWVNKLNDEGLLDPDALVQKLDQYKAKMATGRVLCTFGASWMFGEAQSALRKNDPNRAFVPEPVMQSSGLKDELLRSAGFVPGYGIGITTSATKEHAKAAIKLFDYMCSDEGQILTHWGIKGENYTIVNGKRKQTAATVKGLATDKYYGKKTGMNQYTYPFPEIGAGVKDKSGDFYTTISKEQQSSQYGSGEKDVEKAYKVDAFLDIFTKEDSIPDSPWGYAWQAQIPASDQATVIGKKIDDKMKTAVPDMILAKPSQFESKWKDFVISCKDLGQAKYESTFSKLIKERMRLLGN